jgi:hypothetical protein
MPCRALLVSTLASLFALSAHAGTLTNATWFQTAQGIPMTRTFGQLGAAGSSTGASIAVNLSYPFFTATVLLPKTASRTLDLIVQVSQGGAQSITATANGANGIPGVPGNVLVVTAVHVAKGVNQSHFMVGTNTIVAVPLSAGKAGNFTGTFSVVGVLHHLTVQFYAWTPGGLTFTGLTSKGVALPNVTANGSFNLTPQGGGTVTLVSPSLVSIDGSLAGRRTAAFTKLVLNFVPEPATLLLLGGAGLALLLANRRWPH